MIYEMGKPVGMMPRTRAPAPSAAATDGAALLDEIRAQHHLTSDTQLAKMLGVSSTTIHRLRHKNTPVSDSVVLRLHQITGLKITVLHKRLNGQNRKESNDAKK